MAMDANEIERLIRARIPDADVTIRDLAEEGMTCMIVTEMSESLMRGS